MSVVRQDVEEDSNQIQTVARDVGYLKDGAYSLADELGLALHVIMGG